LDLVHGHDLVKIFVIGLAKKIGKAKCSKTSADEVERALRLSYSHADFVKTKLYSKLLESEKKIKVKILQN